MAIRTHGAQIVRPISALRAVPGPQVFTVFARANVTSARIVSTAANRRYECGGRYHRRSGDSGLRADIARARGCRSIDLQIGERVRWSPATSSGSGTGIGCASNTWCRLGDYDEKRDRGLSLERRQRKSALRLDGATIIDTQFGGNARLDLTTLTGGGGQRTEPEGRGAPAGRDRGVDGVLAGERRHLRDRRDRHGAPRRCART